MVVRLKLMRERWPSVFGGDCHFSLFRREKKCSSAGCLTFIFWRSTGDALIVSLRSHWSCRNKKLLMYRIMILLFCRIYSPAAWTWQLLQTLPTETTRIKVSFSIYIYGLYASCMCEFEIINIIKLIYFKRTLILILCDLCLGEKLDQVSTLAIYQHIPSLKEYAAHLNPLTW